MKALDTLYSTMQRGLHLLNRREVRTGIVTITMLVSAPLFAGDPGAMASAIGDSSKGWIMWLIRIIAGGMSGGGFWALIMGLNGNDDGFMKGLKVFGGLILMGAGIYFLGKPLTLYNALNLNQMFSTTVQ